MRTPPPREPHSRGTLAALLREQARERGDAPALLALGRSALSHAELYAQVQRLGGHLRALGATPATRVAVVLPNGPEMAAAFLGVTACAACAPLNPAYQATELRFHLQDTRAEMLLMLGSERGLAREVARELGLAIVEIEVDDAAPAGRFRLVGELAPPATDGVACAAHDVALLLHTSGTTAGPKLVPLSQGNLMASAHNIAAHLRLSAQDRCLNVMPLFHIHGLVGALLATLAGGGSIVCTPGFDERCFFDGIAAFDPSWYSAVPTIHQAVLAYGAAYRQKAPKHRFRFVRSSSAALPAATLRQLQELLQAPVVEAYGMTEASHQMASNPVLAGAQTAGCVGVAAGVQIAILDVTQGTEGRHVGTGQPGEIAVRGPGVTRGYENNPQANAEAFHDGWFRTGDLGHLDAQGRLFISGRIKEIVNRGGEKISPREVDDALLEHPELAQATAFGVPHPSLGEDLAAAVVRRAGSTVDEAALRQHLFSRLADFKVPSQIVFVQRVPTGATGKVQRGSLHQRLGGSLARAFVAPATPTECAVEANFREVLEGGPLGLHDNFFASGGDSLRGARVIARINQQFGLDLPVVALFRHPSIAELVLAMRAAQAASVGNDAALAAEIEALADDQLARPAAHPISPRQHSGPLACSFSQEALWVVEKLVGGGGVYNIAQTLRIGVALDVAALDAALQALLQRHEVLRTAFQEHDGVPMQAVRASVACPLAVIDARGMLAEGGEPALQQALIERAQQPFDLTQAPLLRASLWRLGEQEHVLLLVVHHIVADGWSMQVIGRELTALYSAFKAVQPSPLAPLTLQFADWALWQRERLQGDTLAGPLRYWADRLAGLAPLEMPTDFKRPAALSYAGRSERFTLPADLLAKLNALALQHGATLFMLLLAAFKVVLMRYAGQTDVAVGSPVAGRTPPEAEGLVGYFVNSVVLRSDLSGNPLFSEALARVRQTALDAYTHQDLPFDKLVAELSPQRDLSRNPLVQVSFALNNQPPPVYTLGGAAAVALPLEMEIAKFDLSLTFVQADGELRGVIEYSTELFERATMQRLATHVHNLLAGVAADAEQAIGQLPLLSAAERDLILHEWNRPEQAHPQHFNVQTLVEQQVARAPLAIAAVFGNQRLSYAELNVQANRLAYHLRNLGVAPEVPVAVCMERSLQLVVALLAVLKAGGALVPLDPELPIQRLAFMLQDSAARVLLTQRNLAASRIPELAGESSVDVVCLDAAWPALAERPEDNPACVTQPAQLATLIYTSGSTGQPKGVLLEHRGWCNHMRWMQQRLQIVPGDRFVQITSIGFDAALVELLMPLQAGATLVLAAPGEHRDSAALARLIDGQAITILQMVPSALHSLLAEPRFAGTSLRHVICGGEALDHGLANQLQQHLPNATLGNFYGPTETWIDATHFEVPRPPGGTGTVTIGRPIANTQCYVLDEQLQPVPIGAAGELFIGGIGLARGYLNRPELTAERFIPHPFKAGERLYRSGDRARWRADGLLEYLGRIDFQVKIRGQRIELGEIEAALNAQPGVRQAAVIAREDAPGALRLVAYVVGSQLDLARLKEQLAALLPQAMLPSAFVSLPALPTLANGKLDRRALPAPPSATGPAAPVPPRTPTEQAAWEIWRDVLRTSAFGVHDNFFDLGGQSLLAAQTMARLRAALQIELPLRVLFDAPTVAGLALRADQTAHDGASPSAPIVPRGHDRPVALSAVQRSMWVAERMQGEGAAYHLPSAERLRGPLNTEALEQALGALVQCHDSLRLCIVEVDGAPWQRLDAEATLGLDVIDLAALPATARQKRLHTLMQHHADLPFELGQAPLARAMLVKLGDEEHVFQLVLHHLVSDGWSDQLLSQDLSALYQAFAEGRPAPPAHGGPGYLDYAAWEAARIQSGALAPHLRYWTQRLAGLEPLNLPFVAGSAAVAETPDDGPATPADPWLTFTLPTHVATDLAALARRNHATLFMVYLAALKLLLMRWCGQTDIAVGTPIARRDRPELAQMVGPLLNTLVLRTDLSGEPSFEALLARVRDTALHAYLHQEQPFDGLVAALNPQRVAGRNPLFDVLVNSLPDTGGEPTLAGVASEPIELDFGAAKFALTLYIDSRPARTDFRLHYRGALFAPGQMAALLDQFGHLLTQLAAQRQRPITAHSLVTESARALLPDPSLPLRRAPTQAQTIFAAFLAQANAHPDAPAAASDDGELSYGELERLSRGLAEWLVARGIRAGDRIAIHADRCLGLPVAVLGAARAGAVFSILDSAYPDPRNQSCIAQLAPRLVLVCGDHAWAAPHALPAQRIAARPHRLLHELQRSSVGLQAAPTRSGPPTLPVPDPSAPAYISFTSGTSGRPKGIVTAHAPLPHFVGWHVAQHGLLREDRFAMLSGLSHDPLLRDLFTPLAIGAVLCIPSAAALQRPGALVAWLAAQRVTVAHLTPALGDVITTGCDGERRLGTLRRVFWGGEMLTGRTVERLRAAAPDALQVNFYGATETPQAMAHWPVPAGRVAHALPVGRGIHAAQLLLLRANGTQAGIGEAAEVWIRTPYLALGYLDDAPLTQARFVNNPFSTDPEDRCYRTGDLGRCDSDGNVVLLGRIDAQIKVRGLRIEPGEIEQVAQSVPAVERAVVRPVQDDQGQTTMLLYFSCHAGADVPTLAVEAAIRQALPSAMWPRAVIGVAGFKRLPNGKVDLRALPDAVPDIDRPTRADELPRGETETAIAMVWQELLPVALVGRADNFFDLGGHSLLALRAVHAIDKRCGLKLDPRRLVYESLAQLAASEPTAPTEPPGLPASTGLVGRLLDSIGLGRGGGVN